MVKKTVKIKCKYKSDTTMVKKENMLLKSGKDQVKVLFINDGTVKPLEPTYINPERTGHKTPITTLLMVKLE